MYKRKVLHHCIMLKLYQQETFALGDSILNSNVAAPVAAARRHPTRRATECLLRDIGFLELK